MKSIKSMWKMPNLCGRRPRRRLKGKLFAGRPLGHVTQSGIESIAAMSAQAMRETFHAGLVVAAQKGAMLIRESGTRRNWRRDTCGVVAQPALNQHVPQTASLGLIATQSQ